MDTKKRLQHEYQEKYLTALSLFDNGDKFEFRIPGSDIALGKMEYADNGQFVQCYDVAQTDDLWSEIFSRRKVEILASIKHQFPDHNFAPIEFGKIRIQNPDGGHVVILKVGFKNWSYEFTPCAPRVAENGPFLAN